MRWRCDPDYESARNLSQRLVQIARATEDGIVTSKESGATPNFSWAVEGGIPQSTRQCERCAPGT